MFLTDAWKAKLDRWSAIATRTIAIGGFLIAVYSIVTPAAREWLAAVVLNSDAFQCQAEAGPQFGGWVENSRVNTNYRAETDGFVVLFSRGGIADILADPESNPTTIRSRLARAAG